MMSAIGNQNNIIPNIEKIRFVIKDATGLDVMYAYEDLFFAEHGAFLIKICENNQNLLECFFHVDCETHASLKILQKLMISAQLNGMSLLDKGKFDMKQDKGEETFSLTFYE